MFKESLAAIKRDGFSVIIGRRIHRILSLMIKGTEIRRYVRSNEIKKLQLGSGPHILDSWLNTDLHGFISPKGKVLSLNITRPFPFQSNIFDYIFSEHLIEHVQYEDGRRMLSECFRVLKSGGKVRIATPDLRFLIALYNKKKSKLQKRYINHSVNTYLNLSNLQIYQDTFVINNFFRDWGHKFIYDFLALKYTLENIGFTNIRRCKIGKSSDCHLRNLESHGKIIGEDFNKLETLIVEATKP